MTGMNSYIQANHAVEVTSACIYESRKAADVCVVIKLISHSVQFTGPVGRTVYFTRITKVYDMIDDQ